MKKNVLLMAIACSSLYLQAQLTKRNYQLILSGETFFPVCPSRSGYGLQIEYLKPVNTTGNFTVATGGRYFRESNSLYPRSMLMIPVLAGYRQRLKRFFIEPQIGAGKLFELTKPFNTDRTQRLSNNAFMYGVQTGFAGKKMSIGATFINARSLNNVENNNYWVEKNFRNYGLFLGYRIK
jgi:hypothetical protein